MLGNGTSFPDVCVLDPQSMPVLHQSMVSKIKLGDGTCIPDFVIIDIIGSLLSLLIVSVEKALVKWLIGCSFMSISR